MGSLVALAPYQDYSNASLPRRQCVSSRHSDQLFVRRKRKRAPEGTARPVTVLAARTGADGMFSVVVFEPTTHRRKRMIRAATIACVLIGTGLAGGAHARPIDDIEEAGIFCSGDLPEHIGPKFYRAVRKKCRGKHECRVTPTMVAPKETFKKYGCSRFFVWAICSGEQVEFSAKSISERLRVFCPGKTRVKKPLFYGRFKRPSR
jgi:hypothetical protein